jgi:hypothetical protein
MLGRARKTLLILKRLSQGLLGDKLVTIEDHALARILDNWQDPEHAPARERCQKKGSI